ncbi:MAG TPA: hypothetical protein VLI04_08555 [Nocardioidaceae bacterium]|nr:hypothetical protein [Nocardioidaceae bacterium]
MDVVRRLLASLAIVVALTGCDALNTTGDEANATPRSLAALVIQYLPDTPSAAYDGQLPGKTSAKVEFGPDASPDSVLVSVEEIEPGEADTLRKICVGCDITELSDGSTMHVTRGDRLPGVGLGETKYVRVSIFREREIVELTYEGRAIRVNGKEFDRPLLYLERIIEIAQDPSMGLTTVQGFLDQGDKITVWRNEP